jgi:phenylpropionate dioxygenase-like ring-hydroxylating dioxygenase large terminal subunit
MSSRLNVRWPMDLDGPKESLEAKQPPIDNGLDVVHPSRYTSREFMEREWQHLWPRVWLLAGVVSDIPRPGDYFTYDHGHESFVVVRQQDMGIKAFYNVCPHRGNRIALAEFNSTDSFTCAFHGWNFATDGKLTEITEENTFDPKLIAHRPGLNEIRCDVAGGLIFINMDPQAPELRDSIGLPPGYLENYEMEKMHVVRHVRSEWRANWKTGIDAFYETYHLPYVHPQTQTVMEDYSQIDLYPNGAHRMIVPFGTKAHAIADDESLDDGLRYMMIDAGMSPDEFPQKASEVRGAIQAAKRNRAQRLGLDHYDNFTDGQLIDSWTTGLFPNVQLGMHPEGVFIMRFMPHPSDPERFFYDNMILFRYVDDPDYTVPAWMGLPKDTDVSGAVRPEITHVPVDERPDLGEVLDQDIDLVPVVQKGMRSRGFRGPLWSEMEGRLRHYHKELDRYLGR